MDSRDIDTLVGLDIAKDEAFLHLTPNENVVSHFARKYAADSLGARYTFGPAYSNEQFTLYGGFTSLAKKGVNELVAETERLVNERLGSTNILFAPLSGLHAMMIAILTTTKVGDTVFCLDGEFGGHFATAGVCAGTGRVAKRIPFNKQTLDIDYDGLGHMASKEEGNYVIYIDASYSLIPFDVARLKQIADTHIVIYDASHTIGLMLGGQFPNPLSQGADIVSANTHKTLPGSHKGMLLFRDAKLFAEVDGPGHAYYSSTHMDHLVTLCISLNEMILFGEDYAKAIVGNANKLGGLLSEWGLPCRKADESMWTHTHQLHLPIAGLGNVETLAKRLFDNNIAVAFDDMFEQGPFIRFGVQEVTRRGITEEQLQKLADIICATLKGEQTKHEVATLLGSLQRVCYSYDQ